MDLELENKVSEVISQLNQLSLEDIDFQKMDPVAKMMLVALIGESQKIEDYLKNIGQKITDRYCSDFIPKEEIEAIPAITLVNPVVKKKDVGLVMVGSGAYFSYKDYTRKLHFDYLPIFNTVVVPHSKVFVLTHQKMSCGTDIKSINIPLKNKMWVGIVTNTEIECLKGFSILLRGINGITPEKIFVGQEERQIDFCTMKDMEKIEMVTPFDAQQASGQFFSFINAWRESLLNMDDATLLYLTDETIDRDLYKPRSYPRVFQQWLEDDALDCFDPNTLWLELDFPDGYSVPDTCDVVLNVLPVANVDVNTVTLTQSSPVAKLQKQEDSFFLRVLETTSSDLKQGFKMVNDEIVIRDFDAACYHDGDLYREVRTLYNKFADNYYAFKEYHSIRDGELLKQLRETINKLGKSVGNSNSKYKFDSGTYAMLNINHTRQSQSVKVNYLTTQGKRGSIPQAGEILENKKIPALDLKVPIIISPMAGADKATADERYELLRYFSLTNDRLYTKMDIDAFLRKEIMATFGKEEFERIYIKINIEGYGGQCSLERGLYIDLEFKDKKNYEKAVTESFDKLMKQKIEGKSCIAMPIVVNLKNLEV